MLEGDAGRQPIRWLEEAVCRLGEATAGRERHELSHNDTDDVTGTAATDDAIGCPALRCDDKQVFHLSIASRRRHEDCFSH